MSISPDYNNPYNFQQLTEKFSKKLAESREDEHGTKKLIKDYLAATTSKDKKYLAMVEANTIKNLQKDFSKEEAAYIISKPFLETMKEEFFRSRGKASKEKLSEELNAVLETAPEGTRDIFSQLHHVIKLSPIDFQSDLQSNLLDACKNAKASDPYIYDALFELYSKVHNLALEQGILGKTKEMEKLNQIAQAISFSITDTAFDLLEDQLKKVSPKEFHTIVSSSLQDLKKAVYAKAKDVMYRPEMLQVAISLINTNLPNVFAHLEKKGTLSKDQKKALDGALQSWNTIFTPPKSTVQLYTRALLSLKQEDLQRIAKDAQEYVKSQLLELKKRITG